MLTPEQYIAKTGIEAVSLNEFKSRFLALGYKLDRSMDCMGIARFMTGPLAGECYKVKTTGLKEADTGKSAFHYQSRRDSNFEKMQALRNEICVIFKDYVLEV